MIPWERTVEILRRNRRRSGKNRIKYNYNKNAHLVTDPLGKIGEETGDELITTKYKYDNNKQNMVILKKNIKKNTTKFD